MVGVNEPLDYAHIATRTPKPVWVRALILIGLAVGIVAVLAAIAFETGIMWDSWN